MPFFTALVAPALVLVLPLLNELSGSAVVGGDGGGELPAVENLPVHLTRRRDRVGARDELDEGDSAALAGLAVFEDRDSGDLAEVGEEGVEVRVGERIVEV
ncbi:RNA recognition motif and CCHC-type zinc finger domains containing protein [Prunus dulcis]|uniref:RNA recognition motif and CCHC-type zinc finger domains containing protein n=1 Tax=Prunus dulcis TaxID=3755 RepID=A0A4Y1R110_PRUDU|nr:RNA recognition motif and CCHC-type zinc finger domains containing protein [Prunus dulcis]